MAELLANAMEISKLIGCRYIFLRAVKEEWLIKWYKSYVFKEIPFEVLDDYTQPMAYKLPTVQELTDNEFFNLF